MSLQARRLRNLAWRISLWNRGVIACTVHQSDIDLLASYKLQSEWFSDFTVDEQFLFVLFVADAEDTE